MDEETLQANMTTLKEMVLDEERFVTYVTLSKELCIHVNDSKLLLNKLVEDIKQKGPVDTVNVSYIISGITEDFKGRTTVAAEQNVADARNTFKTIFFEHVYSVNKGLPNVDKVAFLAVSKFEDFPLCTGLIKSNLCVKRSADEISTLKSNSQTTVQVESKPSNSLQKKIKTEPKEIKNVHTEPEEVSKICESKSEPAITQIKGEVSSPKKHQSSSGKPKQEIKKNGHKSQKGIAGFFNKQNGTPIKKGKENVIKSKDDIRELKVEKEKSEIEPEKMEIDEEVENKQKKPESNKETPKSKETPRNKSLNQMKKNAKVDKKRKRVLHVSDSESDGENSPFVDDPEPNMEQESEDEIPPTPAVKTLKITSGIINPKKRRKIVDKTYTDEDGYILTKKEEVYESCSDNDEELPSKENIVEGNQVKVSPKKIELSPKKNGSKNSKKKISPPQKGKQATLMNFFKKM